MREIIVCSSCGKEFVPEFVKEGEKVFCGATKNYAIAIKQEIPE